MGKTACRRARFAQLPLCRSCTKNTAASSRVLQTWGYKLPTSLVINARAESVLEKPLFRDSVRQRRCIVPTSGFYEWDAEKHKYFFQQGRNQAMYLAGLTLMQNGAPSYCIITTAANDSMKTVHDRMPLILSKEQAADWILDSSATGGSSAAGSADVGERECRRTASLFLIYASGIQSADSSSKYAYVSGVNSLSCANVRVLPESQYAKNSAKYSRLLLLACCFIGADAASRAYRSLCACGKPIVQSRKCPNSCRIALASKNVNPLLCVCRRADAIHAELAAEICKVLRADHERPAVFIESIKDRLWNLCGVPAGMRSHSTVSDFPL